MAQFDILSVEFDFEASDEDQPAPLKVTIDNPQHMQLAGALTHQLPSDVEEVPDGELPSQPYWVHLNDNHLTITLKAGTEANPLVVSNTDYFNFGSEPNKLLDIVIAEKKDGDKKTRFIRRKSTSVSQG